MTTPPTYGPVDPLATQPRYTTLENVKALLRIPTGTTTFDKRIIQAIVTAEYGIDAELGRSFPDPDGDGQIQGIPVTVVQAAEAVTLQIYKGSDAPTGTAGSDGFFGDLDVGSLVRREIQNNPLLKGLRVSWGVG